jgi:hypothetical protein
VHDFTNAHPSRKLTDFAEKFGSVVLRPMIRDIVRLAEHRGLPPILFEGMGKLPKSGDSVLDELLAEAVRIFRDPAPASSRHAVERLWDAWERLKTLRGANKKASLKAIVEAAAECENFQHLLDSEGTELTRIGNDFHIRHFETGRSAIHRAEHYEYLFHRMYALVHLLLYSESRGAGV